MTIHKLSLEGIEKVRQYLQTVLVVPELENHPRQLSLAEVDEELPEPTSLDALGDLFRAASIPEEVLSMPNLEGRWFLSSANPGAVFAKLPGLWLKPKFRLVTYLLRTTEGGMGQTWALREDYSATAQLEEALLDCGDRAHPPRPPQALDQVMLAVEGDNSPTAYIVASLLSRELQEFGAVGRDRHWSSHRLIGAPPAKIQWDWKIEVPQNLAPKVRVFEDGRAAVEFFSCCVTPPIALFRHLDQYPRQGYGAKQADRLVATAQR